MTPADELRAAAAKLREMAGAATPGEWNAIPIFVITEGCHCPSCTKPTPWAWQVDVVDGPGSGIGCTYPMHINRPDAAWIALMGPEKAGLIATLLDVCAYTQQVHAGCSGLANAMTPEHESALVFARAVLGEKP